MNSRQKILKLSLLMGIFGPFNACTADGSKTQHTINYETEMLGTWHLIAHKSSNSII